MYGEVVNIQSSYYQFGIQLGLPLQEMDAIKRAYQLDIPQAFTEVLRVWLRHRYNVEKYGPPTWCGLVEAVDSPAGGNNHALAKTIAEHHVATVNGPARENSESDVLAKFVAECYPSTIDHGKNTMAMTIASHHHRGIYYSGYCDYNGTSE